MKNLLRYFHVFILIPFIFSSPILAGTAELNKSLTNLVNKFEQQLDTFDDDKSYFIVVGSFYNEQSHTPDEYSIKVKNAVLKNLLHKFSKRKNIVIFNWESSEPLFPKNIPESYSRQKILDKQFIKGLGTGLLVTGKTFLNGNLENINFKMLDMKTGKVLAVSTGDIHLDNDDIKKIKRSGSSVNEKTNRLNTHPFSSTIKTTISPLQKGPETKKPKTVTPNMVNIKKEPENLQYKVVTGDNFTYKGYMKNGKRHGKGTLIFTGGDKYIGEWKNDEKDGYGTYFYSDGDKYTGEWKAGNMTGQGTYEFKNGSKYSGKWKNGKKHGHGIYYYKNGDKWEGIYVDGKRNGQGVYTWKNGKSAKDFWINGKLVK